MDLVAYTKEKNLWIGYWATGIAVYDREKNCFKGYHYGSYDSISLAGYNVLKIFEDSKQNIWIGTESDGLSLLNRKNSTFKHYSFGDLENAGVNTVYEDKNNRLWIGTEKGLVLFDRETKTYKKFTAKDGLPNDFICAILEDNKGNLWLSTNHGISKMAAKEVAGKILLKFKNYDVLDGLQNDQFNKWSYLKTSNGELIFGGINGITIFHPDRIKENTNLPPIVITGFSIFNKTVPINEIGSPLKVSISETKEISLSYKQSEFSFEFAALDYNCPEKNQYAYKLEGFEKDWNYIGNQRKATYTNLNPGHYKFIVKGSNNDGYWNETGTDLIINILPPWWKTLWFRIFSILLILSSIVLFYYIRMALYRQRQEELTFLVKQRTQELEESNKLLHERQAQVEEQANELRVKSSILLEAKDLLEERQIRIEEQSEELKVSNEQLIERQAQIEEQAADLREHSEYLKNVNELLMEKQQLIIEQSDQMKKANQQLSILNATKDKFFSIIAHDLRNPFNIVSGFSEILLNKFDQYPPEKVHKLLSMIYMSSKNGSNLLENLLQWSRSQTGSISYMPSNHNLYAISKETLGFLNNDAELKNISIKHLIDPETYIFADENMVKTILRNLISNAIKFTRENGIIELKSDSNEDHVKVSIADNGIGISKDNIEKLFRIDSTFTIKGTANEIGTGLGLIICKEFVEKQKGKIWVESEPGKGSEFSFTLPLA